MRAEAEAAGHTVYTPLGLQHDVLNPLRSLNQERLAQGQSPLTDEEIAAHFGLPLGAADSKQRRTVGDVRQALRLTTYLGSIDTAFNPASGSPESYEIDERRPMTSVFGQDADDTAEAAMDNLLTEIVDHLLTAVLDDNERRWIRARLGFDDNIERSIMQTARTLGMSITKGRALEARVLAELQNPWRKLWFKGYEDAY